ELMGELSLALKAEQARARDMILNLLSFVYRAEPVLMAKANLLADDPDKRAYAVEVLDNVLSQEPRAFLLPLLQEGAQEQPLSSVGGHFPQEKLELAARLADIAGRPLDGISRWCQACAIDAIGRIDAREDILTVLAQLSSPDPIVRETSLWTLG